MAGRNVIAEGHASINIALVFNEMKAGTAARHRRDNAQRPPSEANFTAAHARRRFNYLK